LYFRVLFWARKGRRGNERKQERREDRDELGRVGPSHCFG